MTFFLVVFALIGIFVQRKAQTYKARRQDAVARTLTLQRSISRDIYDIWYLINQAGLEIEDVAFGFVDKARHKNKEPLSLLEVLDKKEKKYKASWDSSLKHQIRELPEINGVWRGLLVEAKKMTTLLNS